MNELLTLDEHEALDKLVDFINLFCEKVVLDGDSRNGDINEAITYVHALQNMILSQAGARAYPDRFRLLGQ